MAGSLAFSAAAAAAAAARRFCWSARRLAVLSSGDMASNERLAAAALEPGSKTMCLCTWLCHAVDACESLRLLRRGYDCLRGLELIDNRGRVRHHALFALAHRRI